MFYLHGIVRCIDQVEENYVSLCSSRIVCIVCSLGEYDVHTCLANLCPPSLRELFFLHWF